MWDCNDIRSEVCIHNTTWGINKHYTSQNTKHNKGFNVNILDTNGEKLMIYNRIALYYVPILNLMIHSTLSSNISFYSDVNIHFVDMTAAYKQE